MTGNIKEQLRLKAILHHLAGMFQGRWGAKWGGWMDPASKLQSVWCSWAQAIPADGNRHNPVLVYGASEELATLEHGTAVSTQLPWEPQAESKGA